MLARSLQLTFLDGRPVGAYLRFDSRLHPNVVSTKEMSPNLMVDMDQDGAPIGLEIVSFGADVPARVTAVLEELGIPPLSDQEIRRLEVA